MYLNDSNDAYMPATLAVEKGSYDGGNMFSADNSQHGWGYHLDAQKYVERGVMNCPSMTFSNASTIKFYNNTSDISGYDWGRMPFGFNIILGSGYQNGWNNCSTVLSSQVENPSKIILGSETTAEGSYGMFVIGGWQNWTTWVQHAALNGYMAQPHNGGSNTVYGNSGSCNAVFTDGHAATINNARSVIDSSYFRWK